MVIEVGLDPSDLTGGPGHGQNKHDAQTNVLSISRVFALAQFIAIIALCAILRFRDLRFRAATDYDSRLYAINDSLFIALSVFKFMHNFKL